MCGLAAVRMERTRMAHKVIDRLGGVEEATVLGRSTKAPTAVAAAFNSDITYALDADDTLFDSAHFATIVVSSARAEAERVDASGDSLLRAVAVGYDMTARLNLACSFMEVVDGKMKWSELFGSGYGTLGTVVSAGLVSGLSRDRMIHALVAATAPTARNTHNTERTEPATYKHCPNMHVVQAGMTASTLAEAGYPGEPDLLDLEPGFFDAQGFRSVRREAITENIGDRWRILDSAVKYCPAFLLHGCLHRCVARARP
ncbi:MmgE/PrpD family protein [Rhodococcus pyridinivorans]|uniref:MmgE/PrpD family protein n=1 Tax=Rhodococcus pyridinivorans TaxID=103816 RepID=A0A7M2XPR2_9NOCA|nr:MmgE/PrpD family protein [Rhodococcus pyridinivorans]